MSDADVIRWHACRLAALEIETGIQRAIVAAQQSTSRTVGVDPNGEAER